MDTVLSLSNQLAAGRDASLARSGTAWQTSDSAELIATLGQYADQQIAEQTARAASLTCRRVMPRTNESHPLAYGVFALDRPVGYNRQLDLYTLELPPDLLAVTSCRLDGVLYEDGRDYYHKDNYLVFNGQPAATRTLEGFNLLVRSRTLSDFWSNVFHFRDGSAKAESFYRSFWQVGMTTSSPASFNALLAAVFEQPVVKKAGRVVLIEERVGHPPVVCSDVETYHGQLGDIATVQVGDDLYPGDFVFDSLRSWETVEAPPSWLTQLTIPAQYFNGIGPLTVRSTSAPPLDVTMDPGGRAHVQIPVEGNATDVAKFNEQLAEFERQSDTRLAEYLDPRASRAELLSRSFDWLRVLWSIWLRRGVLVSVVRDKPTPSRMARYSQLRRGLPPWVTHLVQFLNPPDDYNGSC